MTKITSVGLATWAVTLNKRAITDSESWEFPSLGGKEKLAEIVVRTGKLLSLYSEMLMKKEFLSNLAHLALDMSEGVFNARGTHTASEMILAKIYKAGWSINTNTQHGQAHKLQDTIFELINDNNAGDLCDLLDQVVVVKKRDPNFSEDLELTNGRFQELLEIAGETVLASDSVPMASTAMAISKKLDCVISLWPYEPLKGDSRAIVYPSRREDGTREYIILYAPSSSQPDSADDLTRYGVAHELAHILLKHPLEGKGRTNRHELEAHLLAHLFVARRGAPVWRVNPCLKEIQRVLDNIVLSEPEKEALLSALTSIYSFPEQDFDESHEKEKICLELEKLEKDPSYLNKIDYEVSAALSNVWI